MRGLAGVVEVIGGLRVLVGGVGVVAGFRLLAGVVGGVGGFRLLVMVVGGFFGFWVSNGRCMVFVRFANAVSARDFNCKAIECRSCVPAEQAAVLVLFHFSVFFRDD